MFKFVFDKINKNNLFIFLWGIFVIFWCIIDPAINFLLFPLGIYDIISGIFGVWKDLNNFYDSIVDGDNEI